MGGRKEFLFNVLNCHIHNISDGDTCLAKGCKWFSGLLQSRLYHDFTIAPSIYNWTLPVAWLLKIYRWKAIVPRLLIYQKLQLHSVLRHLYSKPHNFLATDLATLYLLWKWRTLHNLLASDYRVSVVGQDLCIPSFLLFWCYPFDV